MEISRARILVLVQPVPRDVSSERSRLQQPAAIEMRHICILHSGECGVQMACGSSIGKNDSVWT
jgi:hypothetical protein